LEEGLFIHHDDFYLFAPLKIVFLPEFLAVSPAIMWPNSFRTLIQLEKSTFHIDHTMSILALGSCFSQHMGEKLTQSKFSTCINPFGTLFDPVSIHRVLDGTHLEKGGEDLILHQGCWHALSYHGSFKDKSRDELQNKINGAKEQINNALEKSEILMLTYGTARVWKTKEKNKIVGNCHKIPGDFFYEEMLTPERIKKELYDSISELKRRYPGLKIILTISPVRHLKMGMIENQVSKSILCVAISELIRQIPNLYYFPAYEIMMDDLRDYRFYATDMIHPSDLAIQYIFEGFQEVFFSEETKGRIKIWDNFRKAMNHKPLDSEDEGWKRYKEKCRLQLDQFKKDFPMLDWQEEEIFCYLS
jgi:hypothetical protein